PHSVALTQDRAHPRSPQRTTKPARTARSAASEVERSSRGSSAGPPVPRSAQQPTPPPRDRSGFHPVVPAPEHAEERRSATQPPVRPTEPNRYRSRTGGSPSPESVSPNSASDDRRASLRC